MQSVAEAVSVGRESHRPGSQAATFWNVLDQVYDPELPGVSLWNLGVLRNIQISANNVLVTITPTYSGCPAIDAMKQDIVAALSPLTEKQILIELSLTPAWTTDDILPEGLSQLRQLGIAPPNRVPDLQSPNKTISAVIPSTDFHQTVHCPLCDSSNTMVISEFGSTSCKALYRCESCLEPFDYFKPL